MSRKNMDRPLAAASAGIMLAAWIAGGTRSEDAVLETIRKISNEIVKIREVRPSVFEGWRREKPDEKVYIALADHPSYGGPLQVAIVISEQERIERVALVQSTDTSSYLNRVLGEGVLDSYLGTAGSQLPRVDAISGATLSSTAIIKGVEKAVAHIRNTPLPREQASAFSYREVVKSSLTMLCFLSAMFISRRNFTWSRKYSRLGLLMASTVILGFMYGAQFSLSSLVLLLSGVWIKGVASYTALLCLVAAVVVFLLTRKNQFCGSICPFGGVQEGLSIITGCSAPKRNGWMKWTARMLALTAVSMALYFRDPSNAMYEPFGMAFSFIGSTLLFVLTCTIVISSLVLKRPWCHLLCPITPVFDYIAVLRAWFMPLGQKHPEAEQ